jgi:hypothetical protein
MLQRSRLYSVKGVNLQSASRLRQETYLKDVSSVSVDGEG